MIKTRQIGIKMLVATACVATCGLAAQGQEASTDSPTVANQNQPTLQQPASPIAPGQQIRRANRCSSLIGAQVKDAQGNNLGKIDDVVVDYHTGRVSYCALKVENSQLGNKKFLPIPLAALQPSSDGQYFTLNADKERIAQARGFSDNDWPAANSPTWGAQPVADTAAMQPDQGQYIPPVTVTGAAAADLDVATLPVPPADPLIGNQPVVASPSDQFVTSPTGPFPTFTHVYLPGAIPR